MSLRALHSFSCVRVPVYRAHSVAVTAGVPSGPFPEEQAQRHL